MTVGSAPAQNPQSRRQFLKSLAAGVMVAGGGALTWGSDLGPKVVVVGAGLAGLTCAYRLKQAGIRAAVYEANSRLGGRCWTRRGDFAEGQIAEHGGELIDQSHTSIRQLCQELRLRLDNVLAAEQNGTEPFYYFDNLPYSYVAATRDIKDVWKKIKRDLSEASYPTLYNNYTERGLELDHMSIIDWIEESIPGGRNAPLGQLLETAYNIEYGAECDRQSALNLLYLLGFSGQGQLRIFGPSNEKYHVSGGNDQIVTRLATALEDQIETSTALVAIRRTTDGRIQLTFENGAAPFDVVVEKVILALPFSILNSLIDTSAAGFSVLKQTAIQELAMGTNSKLNVQFNSRAWRELGNNGDTFGDTGYQATWEVSRAQPGSSGILVDYTGGDYGATFGLGTPAERAALFLEQLEPVLPGITQHWNGLATIDFWLGNPYTLGSYSYWQPGQYTKFAGIEGQQEGNVHFCGEHTSIDAQGYLEGAVETGERAAAEVAHDLSRKATK
jgi:monoamine oxidase